MHFGSVSSLPQPFPHVIALPIPQPSKSTGFPIPGPLVAFLALCKVVFSMIKYPGLVYFSSIFLFVSSPAGRSAQAPHDFGKWEKEISAFEQTDRTNPPPKGAQLFIGSSTIKLWKTLATDFPNRRVINRGFGGSEIVDSTHFAERVIFPYQPAKVFLRAGGNDLWAGKSVEQVFDDFKEFVSKIQAKLPETEIVFISLSPSVARWRQADKEKAVNDLIEKFARRSTRVRFI